jgi:hypothetical protein
MKESKTRTRSYLALGLFLAVACLPFVKVRYKAPSPTPHAQSPPQTSKNKPGEGIQALLDRRKGQMAVTISCHLLGGQSFRPGSKVAVFSAYKDPTTNTQRVTLLVPEVEILPIGSMEMNLVEPKRRDRVVLQVPSAGDAMRVSYYSGIGRTYLVATTTLHKACHIVGVALIFRDYQPPLTSVKTLSGSRSRGRAARGTPPCPYLWTSGRT